MQTQATVWKWGRAAVAVMAAATLGGCWLFAANERVRGHEVKAQYGGLADKSVAVVVYAEQADTNEFPAARQEVSAFVTSQMREHMPTTRLLDYRMVIRWQDETLNWFAIPEKDIAKHFGVDRVVFIELLSYSTRMTNTDSDLQGHVRGQCKVFEAESPGTSPAWTGVVDVRWPKDRPLDPTQLNEDAVRLNTLKFFAKDLVDSFYDHREVPQSMRERN